VAFGKIWAGSRRLSLGQENRMLLKPKESRYTLAEGLWHLLRTTFRLMVYEKAVCRYETRVDSQKLVFCIDKTHLDGYIHFLRRADIHWQRVSGIYLGQHFV